MADHNSYGHFKRWAIALVALSFAVLLLAAFESFISSNFGETICLILLFGVPMLVQICGVGSLDSKFTRAHEKLAKAVNESVESSREHAPTRTSAKKNQAKNATKSAEPEAEEIEALERYSKFYFYTMALCLVMYSAMWMAYGIGQHHYHWEDPKQYVNALVNMAWYWRLVLHLLSIFVLLVIAGLLFLVMWMTRAVISGEVASHHHSKRLPKFLDLYYLRLGAAQAPFLTLVFFLTVFLAVSYLFGFAFAFHDKSMAPREPALIMRNLVIPEPSTSSSSTSSASPKPNAAPIATLIFESGLSVPSNDAKSNDALEAAANTIKEKTKDDNPVRILIVGGADLRQIESVAYQSNYELAEARAFHVKNLIAEKLSSRDPGTLRNVEWVCLSKPNEGAASRRRSRLKARDQPIEAKEDRKVEVFAEQNSEGPSSLLVRHLRANHLKPLHLMDYIYFANYTITTTGYGDIVPNSVYAQFICSFANIAEVFFLVVFFNTLLSLVGRRSMKTMADKVEDVEGQVKAIKEQVGALHTKYALKDSPRRLT